jgi:hypothetical protein
MADDITAMAAAPMSKLVERYTLLRERKKAAEVEHEKAMAPFVDALDKLSRAMLKKLHDEGQTSSKTLHGTAYVYTQKTSNIVDFDALWAYIVENDKPELLQRRLTISEVEALNEANPEAPVPGVHVDAIQTVRVKK